MRCGHAQRPSATNPTAAKAHDAEQYAANWHQDDPDYLDSLLLWENLGPRLSAYTNAWNAVKSQEQQTGSAVGAGEPAPLGGREGYMSDIIRIERLTKRFATVVGVDDVTLSVAEGEFVTLLGPSGCGKSTLLRMLGGFEEPTSGRIWLDGKDVTGLPPNRRDVNMVFQDYALFPHMSVGKNVGYGLRAAGMPKAQAATQAREALALVGLADRIRRRAAPTVGRSAAACGTGAGHRAAAQGPVAGRAAVGADAKLAPGDAGGVRSIWTTKA